MTSILGSDGARMSPRDFVAAARRGVKSFTWYGTYPEACALVMGYDEGFGRGRLLDGFQRWIARRHQIGANIVFWLPVLWEAFPDSGIDEALELSPAQHATAVAKLFELLSD